MRTALILPRHRRPRKPNAPRLDGAETLRACELAAIRVKGAGDELTAHWVTLAQAAVNGADAADLLRAREWCQVLEGRLEERVEALHQARQKLDEAWCETSLTQGQPWRGSELPDQELSFDRENPTWSLLAKSNRVASAKSLPQHRK